MSNIGAGTLTLTGLHPAQNNTQTQTTQLRGINFNNQNTTQNTQVISRKDNSTISRQNYGTVPASSDDLPQIFDTPDTTNNTKTQSGDKPKVAVPKSGSAQNKDYMYTGIGMAIGAVAFGVAGSFIAPGAGTAAGLSTGAKIGALVGVAIGGFAGHHIGK